MKGPTKALMTSMSSFLNKGNRDIVYIYLYILRRMSKIRLSAEEWALVNDPQVLILKNNILQKAELLLGQIALVGQQALNGQLPVEATPLLQTMPKLSKGEQYKGLPYRILDYPRLFSKEEVFACRTFFWWGHTFTFMVHLKGIYQQYYGNALLEAAYHASKEEWRIALNGDEWEHDAMSYPSLQSSPMEQWSRILEQAPYMKLYYPISLLDWEMLPEKIREAYRLLAGAITGAHQLPKR